MNNHKRLKCTCVEDLIRQSKADKISFQGLAIMYRPDGSSVQGLMTVREPIILGGRKRIAIMGFRYCPFCGEKLVEEPNKEETET